jgi:hypothetical protein
MPTPGEPSCRLAMSFCTNTQSIVRRSAMRPSLCPLDNDASRTGACARRTASVTRGGSSRFTRHAYLYPPISGSTRSSSTWTLDSYGRPGSPNLKLCASSSPLALAMELALMCGPLLAPAESTRRARLLRLHFTNDLLQTCDSIPHPAVTRLETFLRKFSR